MSAKSSVFTDSQTGLATISINNAGSFTSFDIPGGGSVFGINDLGEMVGVGHDPGLSGFLYSKGTVTTIAFPGALRTGRKGDKRFGRNNRRVFNFQYPPTAWIFV